MTEISVKRQAIVFLINCYDEIVKRKNYKDLTIKLKKTRKEFKTMEPILHYIMGITLTYKNLEIKGLDIEPKEYFFRWVSGYTYDHTEKILEIQFTSCFLPSATILDFVKCIYRKELSKEK